MPAPRGARMASIRGMFAPFAPSPSRAKPLAGWSAVLLACVCGLSACATPPAANADDPIPIRLHKLGRSEVLMLGEQHDAPEHQGIHHQVVNALVDSGELAALVLEMAEAGHSTRDLPAAATEQQVQHALDWREAAWPWQAYGPAVMAAVAAGVPVLGGNLPRQLNAATFRDPEWDGRVSPEVLQHQREAVREGHCDLLPRDQVAPMARIQLARDARLADTVQSVRQRHRTVVLLTGSQHAHRQWGVARHLPAEVTVKSVRLAADLGRADDAQGFDAVWTTPPIPPTDHCSQLKKQLGL